MSNIDYLVRSRLKPGEADDLRLSLVSAGETCLIVHCGEIRTKADFLNVAAAALQFPWYFGHNWDAFEECVQDMSWMPGDKIVAIFADFDCLKQAISGDVQVLFDILKNAERKGIAAFRGESANRRHLEVLFFR